MTMRGEQFRSLALAILLAIGAGLIWGFAGGWGMSIVNDIVLSGQLHEQLLFLRDGTPVIESYAGRHYESRTFRKLDGTNIEVADDFFNNGERLAGTGIPEQTLHRPAVERKDRVRLQLLVCPRSLVFRA